MKHLLGYVFLENRVGTCVELVNGARTLALIDRARRNPSGVDGCRAHPSWFVRDAYDPGYWDGIDCWSFNTGQYGDDSSLWDNPLGDQDLNPWEDSDNPATFETAGFIPDAPGRGLGVMIEPPTSERVIESDRVEPLELEITGTVVSGTARGESAWLQWLNRVMLEPESFHYGWTATVFTHCPDQTEWAAIADPFDIPADPSGEPAYTTWDDPTPNLLTAYTDPTPFPIDSGLWQLFRVKFRSIDELDDRPLFPHCVGRRYVIRFRVERHAVYDRPRTLAVLGGAGEWDPAETYSLPLGVGNPVREVNPFDLGPPGLPVPTDPGASAGLLGRSGTWSRPESVLREAALTPARPVTLRDQLVVDIHNPSSTSTIYNARVLLYNAIVDQAHPNTQVGDAFYRDQTPVAELRIVKLQPGETLTYDGRTRQVRLSAPGIVYDVVPGRIEGSSSSRVETPALECNRRYWAVAELSASPGSYGNLDMTVTVRGAMEQIPT